MKPNSNKLLFRKTQFNLLQCVGILDKAATIEDSQRFKFRLGSQENIKQIRRSALLNLLVSSYRYTKTNRKLSAFNYALTTLHETVMLAQMLKRINGQGRKSAATDSIYASQLSTLRSSRYHKIQQRRITAPGNPTAFEENISITVNEEEPVLIEVTYASYDQVIQMLHKINEHNWSQAKEDTIQAFYMPFCERIYAIVNIQNWYRGILFRRKLQPVLEVNKSQKRFVLSSKGGSIAGRDINVNNTSPRHFLLLSNTAKKIQRCFRRWTLRSRINSLIDIANYAAKISTNTLFLEQTLYLNLEKIIIQRLEKRQALIERGFRFVVDEIDCKVKIDYSKEVDQAGRYYQNFLTQPKNIPESREEAEKDEQSFIEDKPESVSTLPIWFQEMTNAEVPRGNTLFQGTVILTNSKGEKRQKSSLINDIMSLIHKMSPESSNSKELKSPSVVYLSEITSTKLESGMSDLKFIKVVYPTVKEAKNRAIVLALLSCDIRKPRDTFVKLFQQSCFNVLNIQQTQSQVQKMHHLLFSMRPGLPQFFSDNDSLIASPFFYQKQPHNGLLNKKEYQVKQLIKAKARRNAKFERYIVLPNADPIDVQELLGNAISSKKIVFADKQPVNDLKTANSASLIPKLEPNAVKKFLKEPLQHKSVPDILKQIRSRQNFQKQLKEGHNEYEKDSVNAIKVLANKQKTIEDGSKDLLTAKSFSKTSKTYENSQQLTKPQKIQMLRRKIQELKKRVANHSLIAPGLEKVFSQQLTAFLSPNESPTKKQGSNSGTKMEPIYINSSAQQPILPAAKDNDSTSKNQFKYSERMIKHLQKSKTPDDQIEQLLTEYLKQREAYKSAISVYSSALDQIDKESLEDAAEKKFLLEIAADIQSKQPQATTTSSDPFETILLSIESRLSPTQNAAQTKQDASTSPKSEEENQMRRTMQIFAFEPGAFNENSSRKIIDSYDNVVRKQLSFSVTKDQKKVVQQKILNLNKVKTTLSKENQMIRMIKKREEDDFTKSFVNQSNQLRNISHQAFMNIKRSSLKQTNESQAFKIKIQRKNRENNPTNSILPAPKTVILESLGYDNSQTARTSRLSTPDEKLPKTSKFMLSPQPQQEIISSTTQSNQKMFNGCPKVQQESKVTPLVGQKAIRRIISHSETQLKPLMCKVSQDLTNSVSNEHKSQDLKSAFVKLFVSKSKKQIDQEDKAPLTDRSIQKNVTIRKTINPNGQLPGVAQNSINSQRIKLSHHLFSKTLETPERIPVQQIARNQKKIVILSNKIQPNSSMSPKESIQPDQRLNDMKQSLSLMKQQRSINEPQKKFLKEISLQNRIQNILSQRLDKLASQRDKSYRINKSNSSQFNNTSSSSVLKTQFLDLKNAQKSSVTIEQIMNKRVEKMQDKRSKGKQQASDIASLERQNPQEEVVLYASASDEQDSINEKAKHSIGNLNKFGRFEKDSKVIMQSFGSQSQQMMTVRNATEQRQPYTACHRQVNGNDQAQSMQKLLYNIKQQSSISRQVAQPRSQAMVHRSSRSQFDEIQRSQSMSLQKDGGKYSKFLPSLILNQQQTINRIRGIHSISSQPLK